MRNAESTRLVESPWREHFLDLASSARKSIWIASPYIKAAIVSQFLKATAGARARKRSGLRVRVLTRFDQKDLINGSSDIGAIRQLLETDIKVRSLSALHAKVYIFDEFCSIVTSANKTESGIGSEKSAGNTELGVETTARTHILEHTKEFFEKEWKSGEDVNMSNVKAAEQAMAASSEDIERLRKAEEKVVKHFPARPLDRGQRKDLIVEVAREEYGDREFHRRPLMDAVEKRMRRLQVWPEEYDTRARGSDPTITVGLAKVNWGISNLKTDKRLVHIRHNVWRLPSESKNRARKKGSRD